MKEFRSITHFYLDLGQPSTQEIHLEVTMPPKISGGNEASIMLSSFAATIRVPGEGQTPQEFPLLAQFILGHGGWIIQAKATADTSTDQSLTLAVLLNAALTGNAAQIDVQDTGLASVPRLGSGTAVAVMAVPVATTALISVRLIASGLGGIANFTPIVFTAIRQDELPIFAL
jgi:hypothetical protein